jgi:hypothetical protein
MSTHPKRELTIDIPVAVVLALVAFAYEQFDLPHSKVLGLVILIACLGFVARIIQVTWIWLASRANVTFKHTSEFTWWRRQVITYDIAGMHAYFAGLEIPVPETIPPWTIHDEGQAMYTPPHTYRGELKIPRPQITNRKVITHIYAVYVMQLAFPDPTKSASFFDSIMSNPANAHQLFQITFFSTELREYFHASYWDSKKIEAPTGASILWEIRSALGKRFADNLASKVFLVAVDSPTEISDPDMNTSFRKALKSADNILEAYEQSWPTIQIILDKNPLIVNFQLSPSNPAG